MVTEVKAEPVELITRAREALRSRDYDTAIDILKPLAEAGSAEAQHWFGWMVWSGLGVKQSTAEGFGWLQKGAEQGNAGAQFLLSIHYRNKHDAKFDKNEALKWLLKAAEQGHPYAQRNLGQMYDFGTEGIHLDYPEAYFWYRLSRFTRKKDLQRVEANISSEQKSEVEKRIEAWKQSHPTPAKKRWSYP